MRMLENSVQGLLPTAVSLHVFLVCSHRGTAECIFELQSALVKPSVTTALESTGGYKDGLSLQE